MSFPFLTTDPPVDLEYAEQHWRPRDDDDSSKRLDPAAQLVEQFFVEWEVPQNS